MSYFITFYESHQIVVTDGEKVVLKITHRYYWLKGKIFFKVYIDDIFVLEFYITRFILSLSMGVIYKNISKILEFEKISKKYFLNYENNYYNYKRNFAFKNPIYKFLKNGTEVGEIHVLKKISVGAGLLFRIDFYEDNESNLFQIMFFIANDVESNR